jgi:glycosyltransferase involved in cell wall biosynthesis
MFTPADPARKSALKARFGLSEATIVYAGRLGVEKNIDEVVRAVAAAKDAVPSIGLAIAGHGSDEVRLRKLVAELGLESEVRFFGTLDKATLAQLFQSSELFATMSRSETQCLALIQAMACGLPALGADARALPEFISDRTGVLVEAGDPALLAAEMVRLLGDGARRRQLADGAWRAAQDFSPARIAALWETSYATLAMTARAARAGVAGCRA